MGRLTKDAQPIGPSCPEHGEAVGALLVGDLDPEEARHLEAASRGCDHCASWWISMESSEVFQQVEQGVLAGLQTFTPPAGQSKPWHSELLIAASVLALAVGIPMIASQFDSTPEPTGLEVSSTLVPETGDQSAVVASDEVISSNGFENNGATSWRSDQD